VKCRTTERMFSAELSLLLQYFVETCEMFQHYEKPKTPIVSPSISMDETDRVLAVIHNACLKEKKSISMSYFLARELTWNKFVRITLNSFVFPASKYILARSTFCKSRISEPYIPACGVYWQLVAFWSTLQVMSHDWFNMLNCEQDRWAATKFRLRISVLSASETLSADIFSVLHMVAVLVTYTHRQIALISVTLLWVLTIMQLRVSRDVTN